MKALSLARVTLGILEEITIQYRVRTPQKYKTTGSVPLENSHEREILSNASLTQEIKLENSKQTVVKTFLPRPVI